MRLSQYGLTLTPENRILSLRPTVLTDGLGARIVGWEDGDLAAMELERWAPDGASQPAGPRRTAPPLPAVMPSATPPVAFASVAPVAPVAVAPVASPAASAPPVRVVAAPRPLPGLPPIDEATPTAPMAPVVAMPQPVMPRVVAAPLPRIVAEPPVQAPVVAPDANVEEDDWEWTIALARARGDSEVPANSQQVRAIDPMADDAWPKTEPLSELHAEEEGTGSVADIAGIVRRARMGRVILPAKPTEPMPAVAAPTTARSTVIPVPSLPTADRSAHLAPVVRSQPAPRQLAKGTNPLQPKFMPEETVRAPAYQDPDATRPALVLPQAAAPVSLPSIKRVSRG
ncbi:MAG: hypothetical protein AB7P03_01190 [Kofleriaceae bacterium]